MPVNHWIHNDLKKDVQARLLSSNSFLAQLFTHKQIENLFKPGLSFMKIPQNALLWRAYLFEIYRQEVTSSYWRYFIFKTYTQKTQENRHEIEQENRNENRTNENKTGT